MSYRIPIIPSGGIIVACQPEGYVAHALRGYEPRTGQFLPLCRERGVVVVDNGGAAGGAPALREVGRVGQRNIAASSHAGCHGFDHPGGIEVVVGGVCPTGAVAAQPVAVRVAAVLSINGRIGGCGVENEPQRLAAVEDEGGGEADFMPALGVEYGVLGA